VVVVVMAVGVEVKEEEQAEVVVVVVVAVAVQMKEEEVKEGVEEEEVVAVDVDQGVCIYSQNDLRVVREEACVEKRMWQRFEERIRRLTDIQTQRCSERDGEREGG